MQREVAAGNNAVLRRRETATARAAGVIVSKAVLIIRAKNVLIGFDTTTSTCPGRSDSR